MSEPILSAEQEQLAKQLAESILEKAKEETLRSTGAGFTKGFFPNAPLLVDTYNVRGLLESAERALSDHAKRVLLSELDSRTDGRVNLERLMTRLTGRMPYDRQRGSEEELAWLLAKLTDLFVSRLTDTIGPDPEIPELLKAFARRCL
jgi:hypothetical protein